MNNQFEIDGKTYKTDAETIALLRSLVPQAKEIGDWSAVIAIMALGEMSGRIIEIK